MNWVAAFRIASSSGLESPSPVNSKLVPNDDALAKLATDDQHMVDDGLLLDDVEVFEVLRERCRVIQDKANIKNPR